MSGARGPDPGAPESESGPQPGPGHWYYGEFEEFRTSVSPIPVFPELYADLDLQWLTATDDGERQRLLAIATAELISRFEHLADPRINATFDWPRIAKQLHRVAGRFGELGAEPIAAWLRDLAACLHETHHRLHIECEARIKAALTTGDQQHILDTVAHAAATLNLAADAAATLIADPPRHCSTPPNHQIRTAAIYTLNQERKRTPLADYLDGVAGIAGTPAHHPYVAALYHLELAGHRRTYRLLHQLCVNVGLDTSETNFYWPPDHVDTWPLTGPPAP